MQQYNISYRKKDNSWQYIISYKDGLKWKQKSRQGFSLDKVGKMKCKEAAEKAVEELKIKIDLQGEVNPEYDGITFGEFAKVFVEHQKLYGQKNTLIGYDMALRSFSQLNNILITEIKSINIQKCIDDLVKVELKSSSIKLYLNRVRVVFNYAIKNKIIINSPIDKNIIDIPKSKGKDEKIALTKKELEILLSKIKNKKQYIVSLLASKAGLRIGEIMGLTWDDINTRNCSIKVTKQWKKVSNATYGFGELKSNNSYREVPISQKVLKELLEYKSKYPINFDNRIISNKNNSTMTNILSYTYKKLGFDISVHELRHTYATNLISSGVDFKTASKLLGHDAEQTIKTYSHVTDDMMKNATDLINKIF